MKNFFLLFFCFIGQVQAQVYDFKVNEVASSANLLTQHLLAFENLGIKEPGTKELNNTRDWLYNLYASYGYQPELDTFVVGSNTLYNTIANKKGLSDKYIIVCGHYDTRNGVGTNDNGSGVAVILEMARLIKNIETKYSIRFIHFSGEEIGLRGSMHYANNVLNNKDTNLLFVFNLDQLGGTLGSSENYKIKCESDQDDFPATNNAQSLQVTTKLAHILSLYTTLTPVMDKAFDSDYMPFEDLGYTITGLYQYSHYPQYHTDKDFVAFMDTVALKEIAKGSVAALLHFAEATFIAGSDELLKNGIVIYPNPSLDGNFYIQTAIPLHYTVFDLKGQLLQTGSIKPKANSLHLDVKTGIYFIKLLSNSGESAYYKLTRN